MGSRGELIQRGEGRKLETLAALQLMALGERRWEEWEIKISEITKLRTNEKQKSTKIKIKLKALAFSYDII